MAFVMPFTYCLLPLETGVHAEVVAGEARVRWGHALGAQECERLGVRFSLGVHEHPAGNKGVHSKKRG